MKINSRVDDVSDDISFSLDELTTISNHDSTYNAAIAKSVVRVLGSIGVTLAMMLDHMKNGPMR